MEKNVFEKVDNISNKIEDVSKQVDLLVDQIVDDEDPELSNYPKKRNELMDFAESSNISYFWDGDLKQFKSNKIKSLLTLVVSLLLYVGLIISISININNTLFTILVSPYLNIIFYLLIVVEIVPLILLFVELVKSNIIRESGLRHIHLFIGHLDSLNVPYIINFRYNYALSSVIWMALFVSQIIACIFLKAVVGLDLIILSVITYIFIIVTSNINRKFFRNYTTYRMEGNFKGNHIVIIHDIRLNRLYKEDKYLEKHPWLK